MKRLVLLITTILLITGCKEKQIEKFHLNNKYYNEGNYINIKNLDDLEKDTYVLYTYNNYCTFKKPCDQVFKEYMEKYKIDFYSMNIDYFKKTSFYSKVRYAPSIILVKDGKIVAYLDANDDKDLDKYQDSKIFEEWINKYIYTEGSN